MGFEDIFKGVSFPDAQIPVGQGAPQDAGNAGTPAPATTTGQPVASPATPAPQTAGTQTSEPGTQPAEKPAEKPAPYDQDPKWKKARAAEKALDDILQKHGLLSAEELAERLEKGESLTKLLGSRDAQKLIEDAEYAKRVRENWDKQKLEKQYEGETPDVRLQRLESEKAALEKQFNEYRSNVEDKEHASKVVEGFNTEVNKVLSTLETPYGETERELVSLVLGVNNPANEIDIEDQTAVRKMTRDGIARFNALIQKVKQSAIDDYVAGKSNLAVDTSKGAPASPGQGVQRQPLPKDASVDQVFDNSKNELLEVLMKGLSAAT